LEIPGRASRISRQEYCGTLSPSGRSEASIAVRNAVAVRFNA
jgi:hypothetical protein